jgi:PadR family transcriptional regulator PadR
MTRTKQDLLQGTLDLMVLKVLGSSELHGYGIAKRIELLSREVLRVQQGSLYPSLHRLEKRGLVLSRWGLTDTKRRAKFYALTQAGRDSLEQETASWVSFFHAVNQVLDKA